jgi:sec-independent protein translocase protein TatC
MKNPKKVKKQKKKTKVLDSSHIQDPKLPFNAHVAELRARLMWSALSILCGGVVGYFLYDKILNFLIKPLNQPLYYSSPAGGFDFTFKICLFFGILVSIPILTYHTLKFITPILPVKYHHRLLTFLSVSCVLMALGVCFAYYVSLPAALHL